MVSLLVPDYEGRVKRFREFKQDLQMRLDQWLLDHLDTGLKPQLALPPAPGEILESNNSIWESNTPNLKISVRPSGGVAGSWGVYKGDVVVRMFFSDKAQQDALRFASKILNGNDPDIKS